MPFRGIDPAGLRELAHESFSLASCARSGAGVAFGILDARGYAARLGGAGARIGTWGEEAERNLLWRSRVIGEGQAAAWNPRVLLQAGFAAEAVFELHDIDRAFEGWLEEKAASWQKVDTAVHNIGRWLDQTLTDWDVTNNDLQQVRTTLATLSPAELDRTLHRLSPEQLQRWIAEMGHSLNGFSRDEKAEVFQLLAGNASGQTLGKLHDAALTTGLVDDLVLLGEAIAAAANDDSIVEFVTWVARSGITETRFSGLAPAIAITGIDGRDAATAVLSSLGEDALPGVLVDCLLYDDNHYDSLLATLSRSERADDRAGAFLTAASLAAGGTSLHDLIVARSPQLPDDNKGDRRPSASLVDRMTADLLDAATRFLLADPEAVIENLATEKDTDGTATARYWYLLCEADRAGDFGAIIGALRGGDQVDVEKFIHIGDNPGYSYPHARNLSYTAATLNSGLEMAADEAGNDIDRILGVAGFATTILGMLNRGSEVIATLIGAGADLSLDHHGDRTKERITDRLSELIDRVSTSLRPDEGDGAGAALDAWIDTYSAIHPGI